MLDIRGRWGGQARSRTLAIFAAAGLLTAAGCGSPADTSSPDGPTTGADDADTSAVAAPDEDELGALWSDVQAACTSTEVNASLVTVLSQWGSMYSFSEGSPQDVSCEFDTLNSNGTAVNGYRWSGPLRFTVVEDGPTEEEMGLGPLASATPCSPLVVSDANGRTLCDVAGRGLEVSFSFYTEEFRGTSNRLSEADMSFLLGALVDEFVSNLGTIDGGVAEGEVDVSVSGDEVAAATALLDGEISDLSSLSDEEVGDIAVQFVATWRDLGEEVTTPSYELAEAAVIELESLGLTTGMTVTYHPELDALMLLGGGAEYGIVKDDLLEPLDVAVTDYFEPSSGDFIARPDLATEISERGLSVTTCFTGHLIRTGSRVWSSVNTDPGYEPVRVRDVGDLSPLDRALEC